MKLFSLAVLFSFLFTACQTDTQYSDSIEMTEGNASMETKDEPSSLLRHVVLFKFKEEATSEQIDEVVQAFAALPSKISEIYAYEAGTNNSPEGLNHGYEHCFIVTFLSEEDRAVYLDHPDHLAFVDILLPILEEPTVIDYWAHI